MIFLRRNLSILGKPSLQMWPFRSEFFALMLSALVMGVFWGTWFTLTRSIHDFSAEEFIHIGKTIIANVAVQIGIFCLNAFGPGHGCLLGHMVHINKVNS